MSKLKVKVKLNRNSTNGQGYSNKRPSDSKVKYGLASAFGAGGYYSVIKESIDTVKKYKKKLSNINKNIKGLLGKNTIKEENVFKPDTPKQSGYKGIAGLAKYGFSRILSILKKVKKKEQKGGLNFLKKIVTSKTFWWILAGLGIVVSAVGLIGRLKKYFHVVTPNEPLDYSPNLEEDLGDEEQTQTPINEESSQQELQTQIAQDFYNSAKKKNEEAHIGVFPEESKTIDTYIPKAQTTIPATQKIPLNMPIAGKVVITSRFGHRNAPVAGASTYHKGIDIAAKVGTPVYAPAAGTVSKVYYNKKGGLTVHVKHANGYETRYAHLSSANVKEGQVIQAGQQFAKTGNTGIGTGAHLHYSMLYNGQYVNPEIVSISPTEVIPQQEPVPKIELESEKDVTEKVLELNKAIKSDNGIDLLISKYEQLNNMSFSSEYKESIKQKLQQL